VSARAVDRAAEWVYRGVWGVLAGLFRVPPGAPTLPSRPGEVVDQFHPAPGFLRYLKFWFWFVLALMDGVILAGWIALTVEFPVVGALLAVPALVLAAAPDVVAYVAIHLRYDTTWYVMTPRSVRVRRGIWVIHEVTITFENVQNVRVSSGPVQRWFGIADLVVETAGSGSSGGKHPSTGMNQGLIEGIADAPRLRDLVMSRVKASRAAGLGDEAAHAASHAGTPGWTPDHLEILRQVRDAAVALAGVNR
jgi:membrane protein YdbS with pleckstrin-like domain